MQIELETLKSRNKLQFHRKYSAHSKFRKEMWPRRGKGTELQVRRLHKVRLSEVKCNYQKTIDYTTSQSVMLHSNKGERPTTKFFHNLEIIRYYTLGYFAIFLELRLLNFSYLKLTN